MYLKNRNNQQVLGPVCVVKIMNYNDDNRKFFFCQISFNNAILQDIFHTSVTLQGPVPHDGWLIIE